jgi:DNA-binding MarR family transcriptional regulator
MTESSAADADPTVIVDALAELSFVVLDVLTRCAAELELSMSQLRLLGILRDREPTMAQLAGHLRLDRSSITGLVDRAEKRDLVVRRPSAADGRVTTVALTDAGRGIAEQLEATVGREVGGLVEHTSASDRGTIIRFSKSITPRFP